MWAGRAGGADVSSCLPDYLNSHDDTNTAGRHLAAMAQTPLPHTKTPHSNAVFLP
jgi:hypothetical protein